MKIGRMLVMSAAAVLLAGCAGPRHGEIASQIPPIEAGNGRIYIYQLAQADGANAAEPAILIDGRKVGRSKPGRFFFVDRPAGAHTLATAHYKRSARPALPVPLEAGQTRYVRTDIVAGAQVLRLEESAETAQQNLTGLRYWGAGWRDREKLRY
ncbi:DUF2846 domain-containing protein [Achromobacter ruhlandii]|uniref:DUF2846 domain-containing protein n=1 Tax=Achromobacter ruhlandii TaxID=72557 RepID=UPI0006C03388|nr:DUF2846 domain-containing protein [Achromobacter ruhlandii]AMG47006.1 DUF2846 domain-containing protein [Achromobacter xylosoxidans]CUI53372.1 Protein of uncharacterised function (DUF2846) [Achromobacter ruhlandii]CUJ55097.1 Protein of uncharacterised function (DUF2846) [Achromobacter ruhlandii]CUK12181.1 Protein of uncharacterised function (DUF2846) [Achromobacter ruhlandii]